MKHVRCTLRQLLQTKSNYAIALKCIRCKNQSYYYLFIELNKNRVILFPFFVLLHDKNLAFFIISNQCGNKSLHKAKSRGGNSSSTLVPMREQENAYKGVFFRDERVYARIREKGGKIGPKQEKGCFSKIWEKNA